MTVVLVVDKMQAPHIPVRRKRVLIPMYFHRFYVACGLYTLGKSEYSTAAVESGEEPE